MNCNLFIISGPAGVGKTTLCDRLLIDYTEDLKRVITVTTREPRVGEVDGVDYYFLSKQEFERKKSQKAFLENEIIHGNEYGVLRETVLGGLSDVPNLLLNIDVKGARTIQKAFGRNSSNTGNLISIFISPASIEVLQERLRIRGTDSGEEIRKRMETARQELRSVGFFNYNIRSQDRENDYSQIRQIFLDKRKLKKPAR
ncbi:MAG: guanylate kinase [Opitutales bacterium]